MRKSLTVFACVVPLIFFATPAQSQRILDEALGELAGEIQAKLPVEATIAFIPLEDAASLAREYEIGVTITEFLSAKLLEQGKFSMVERSLLNHVLSELELSRSGLIDLKSAVETGYLLSADTILCGTITAVGRYFDINVRVIDAKTGRISDTFVAELEQDIFVNASPAPSRAIERLQASLDVLDRAIVGYYNLNYERKNNEFTYPNSLQELVPKYIDRIPDPIQGEWTYRAETGEITHSIYTELKPTAPRLNPKPYMDQARRAQIQSSMRQIYVALQQSYIEDGVLPATLDVLEGTYFPDLPDALDGAWTWDQETGTLGHSTHRDLEMKMQVW